MPAPLAPIPTFPQREKGKTGRPVSAKSLWTIRVEMARRDRGVFNAHQHFLRTYKNDLHRLFVCVQ